MCQHSSTGLDSTCVSPKVPTFHQLENPTLDVEVAIIPSPASLPFHGADCPARNQSCSLYLAQVVLDLSRRENLELFVRANDTHLNVGMIHRTLKPFLEGEQSGMHSVL
mmetsp:Transcript_20546/g.62680  ORF Transcript_20546/g.62680 Transcript_20546/m.62680 type:complete len:109 (+) Transcript_20546:426-752(+)